MPARFLAQLPRLSSCSVSASSLRPQAGLLPRHLHTSMPRRDVELSSRDGRDAGHEAGLAGQVKAGGVGGMAGEAVGSGESALKSAQSSPPTQAIPNLHFGPSVLHLPLTSFTQSSPPHPPSVVPLSKHVFGQPPRPDILHSCVMFERSLMRAGSANTKDRSQVAYSGRKIRQQKGTGKARLGSRGSPMLKGGGVTFGPQPKDWSQGLNRKTWELGLRLVLSERWRQGKLHIVDSFDLLECGENLEDLSPYLESIVGKKGWEDSMFISGGKWASGDSSEFDTPKKLRHALSRDSHIKPGIRMGQRGPVWSQQQRLHLFPSLNTIDLVHPSDFAPGKPHTTDWRPGHVGVYHLLLREKVVMDLKGLSELEERLEADLRRPIGALGVGNEEERWAMEQMGKVTLAAKLEAQMKSNA